MIIIPAGIHVPELNPDKEAERGTQFTAPPCQRCSRQATPMNPIGMTRRNVWNPYDPQRLARQYDFICAECREFLAKGH